MRLALRICEKSQSSLVAQVRDFFERLFVMMQSTYTVITDPDALQEFIAWLPDLEKGECYYGALLARSKYCQELGIGTFNSDRHQCDRFLIDKGRLFNRIWQTEVPLEAYKVKDIIVPQEPLAMYLNINPRSHIKAQPFLIRALTESVLSGREKVNLQEDAISVVHKTFGRKYFVDFDLDNVKLEDMLSHLKGAINPNAVTVFQTRGGFHVVVRTKAVENKYRNTWYHHMTKFPGVDVIGDTMLPVPGCVQGGFTPVMKPLSYYL